MKIIRCKCNGKPIKDYRCPAATLDGKYCRATFKCRYQEIVEYVCTANGDEEDTCWLDLGKPENCWIDNRPQKKEDCEYWEEKNV